MPLYAAIRFSKVRKKLYVIAGGFLAYEKSSLNPAYLEARQRTVLEAALPKLGLE